MIRVVIQTDYPIYWPNLRELLVQSLEGSPHNGIYLISKIVKKFTFLQRSDELYQEIVDTIEDFYEPLKFYLNQSLQIIYGGGGNFENLKILITCLKIFYRLIYQDIHPFFENDKH